MTRDNDLMTLFLGGALIAGLAGPALAQVAPSYFGIQGNVAAPTNTNNDNEFEASSEATPGIAAFVGWSLGEWLAIEARGAWLHQKAHGYNPDGPDYRESIEGTFNAVTLQACPVLHWPGLPVTPYLRGCIGPGYRWTDLTHSSVTGRVPNENGVILSYEGAGGIERALGNGVSLRLEGGYASADPIEEWFGGMAVVYAFGE